MYARVLVQAAVFAAASPSLTLPERIRRVVLEVGSNDDPVVAVGEDALTIAFEPLMDVVARTRPHANLRMVPAAVTADGEAGLRAFHFYNDRGWSSSLGTPAQPGQFWNNAPARGDGTVPSPRDVLDAVVAPVCDRFGLKGEACAAPPWPNRGRALAFDSGPHPATRGRLSRGPHQPARAGGSEAASAVAAVRKTAG